MKIAHAILGGAVAAVQGNSALAGAGGAAGGEAIADVIRNTLYDGRPAKDLTEEEKQNISNLAQLAAGLATAAAGGSTSDAATAASASKNSVENNGLSWADGGNAMPVPIAPSTGENMDSISHANTLTREEAIQALKDLVKGKEMSNGSTEIVYIYSAPGVISGAAAVAIEAGVPVAIVKGYVISTTINGGYQLVQKPIEEFSITENVIAGTTGAITAQQGWTGTITWNAIGGATNSAIKGEDPLTGAAGSVSGAVGGKVIDKVGGPIISEIASEIISDTVPNLIKENNKYKDNK